VTQCTTDE